MSKNKCTIIRALVLTALLSITLTGCNNNSKAERVTLYAWGGDERVNDWIDDTLSPYVLKTTGVTLTRVPMNAPDFMAKLTNEKQAGVPGDIDLLWINGENFYSAKENDLLYGPFTGNIDNLSRYADEDAASVDFGFPTDGYEAPWGKAQFVLFYDSSKIADPPVNSAELFEFVRKNPGLFTYPQASDFTGSAFVKTVLYDIVGYDNLKDLDPDYDEVKTVIQPALDYLNEIEPYLWKEGKTYPADSTQLDNLYQNGEVLINMDYSANKALGMVSDGLWPESTRTFVWDAGTPYNTHFLAISGSSAHKEACEKVINAALSPEMQISKADLNGWADIPILDYSKLDESDQEKLNLTLTPDSKYADTLPGYEELDTHKQPELRADLVDLVEQIWKDKVLNE